MYNKKKLMALALVTLVGINEPIVAHANQFSTRELDDFAMFIKSLDTVNVRILPNENSTKLGTVQTGEMIRLSADLKNGWYKIFYDDKYAYVKSEYFELKKVSLKNDNTSKLVMINKDSVIYCDDDTYNINKYEVGEILEKKDTDYLIQTDDYKGLVKICDTEIINEPCVVVDISDQFLKYYEDGEVVLTSDVVTGKPSTPTTIGDFRIFQIRNNTTLVGPGYKSVVDIMMKFHNGEGLHDAQYHSDYDENGKLIKSHGWRERSEFGKDTYLTNGSHGCVNMPHDEAIELSKHVNLGTRVLIKK